jgi:membrane protease YdiL (CAAX protease family)
MRPGIAVIVAVAIHIGRFGVILAGLAVAPLLGIHGWDQGSFVNALCCVYAVILISVLRLWRRVGLAVRRSWSATLWLAPLALGAVAWTIPSGIGDEGIPLPLWAMSFLLVGINEELVSRGAVLTVLRRGFAVVPAVVLTALLFGLQHFSVVATSGVAPLDAATNVGVTAIYGFAFAAYQARFAWIVPLILIHAADDFTSVLSPGAPSDAIQIVVNVVLLVTGIALLGRASSPPRPAGGSSPGRWPRRASPSPDRLA